MSRPIPRRLLIDTIQLFKLLGTDNWNNPTYDSAVAVKYVRVEQIKKNLLNSSGESKDDKAMLFIDTKNSFPVVAYSKGDKVVYGSNEYTIREIDELKGDSSEIHHLEVALT